CSRWGSAARRCPWSPSCPRKRKRPVEWSEPPTVRPSPWRASWSRSSDQVLGRNTASRGVLRDADGDLLGGAGVGEVRGTHLHGARAREHELDGVARVEHAADADDRNVHPRLELPHDTECDGTERRPAEATRRVRDAHVLLLHVYG